MVSVCKQRRPGSMTEKSTLAFVRKNAMIAFSLAILFGLGWGFGLAASGSPSEEVTFALQLLFTIFVGCQGILIFVLHGIRKAEARDEWQKWLSIVTCRRSNGGVVKSSSTLPLSQHAISQVASPSSSGYDMSTLSSLPNETSSEIHFESSADAEKGEIPAKAEVIEFNGANEQGALCKQSLVQAVADVMKTPGNHVKYDMPKAGESPPLQMKMDGEKDSEGWIEACVPSKQHTRRVSAPDPRSTLSESKQTGKHCMSLLTPISGKYDLTAHDTLPPICTCTDSDGTSLLECKEEDEEDERKGEEVEKEEKVNPQPNDTTTETVADSHASVTAKD